MSEEKKNINSKPTDVKQDKQMSLSDERRVKVLSPGMMVFKRFIRNKLAITGMVILLAMFIFSFVCPIFSGYKQDQVFTHYEEIMKEYASARLNTDLRMTVIDGQQFASADFAKMQLALAQNQHTFTSGDREFYIDEISESFYSISSSVQLAKVMYLAKQCTFEDVAEGFEITADFEKAVGDAIGANAESFMYGGEDYVLGRSGKSFSISTTSDVAIASLLAYDSFDAADDAVVNSYTFRRDAELAFRNDDAGFSSDGVDYIFDESRSTITTADGVEFATISQMLVSAFANDVFLTVPFKDAARDAIAANQTAFSFTDENGETAEYQIERKLDNYNMKKFTSSKLITRYEGPTSEHTLGTDSNGMDVITRLMYGGRISLMVGFVVVFIELFIGVIIGGVAGYFGRWIDNLLMRFIDLFNCIPFYPMVMIIGTLMDKLQVDSTQRIFMLMALLGVLGWPGIARIVRGQILSLREQDFMVATEATGVKVSRRIFKHLVPNVMPLLIVYATMNLGGIIISEATLSFLGLGVKYPLASWGSIINAANDQFVLTNYWFIWLPAGILIVLTVLGFNFVGDGLRDAFDPKMKR